MNVANPTHENGAQASPPAVVLLRADEPSAFPFTKERKK